MSTRWRPVFTAMFDDAAMFPPGNASAADALSGHLRLRASLDSDLIGPLLVPARAWADFRYAHAGTGAPALNVVLIGTTTTPMDVPSTLHVSGFEIAVPDTPLPEVPREMSLAAEINIGEAAGRVLAAVAAQASQGRRTVAKFRMGGTSAEAFPGEEIVAHVVASATAVEAPLKLTAGLHHAVRHTDPVTGFEHHGFLNVLVAFAEARDGAETERLSEILAERDRVQLLAALEAIGPDRAMAARRGFVSFGCCGVEDPIRDLVALGLLPSQEEIHAP